MESQKKVVRMKVADVAFTYRMGAGFPGDVNRTHPASISANLVDTIDYPTLYGNVVVYTAANKVRKIKASDQSDSVALRPAGLVVRPFPAQQDSGSNYGAASLGNAAPPQSGIVDVMTKGFAMVKLNAGVTAPVKGGRIYVWAAATSGNHIQGGYETAPSAGNTVALDPSYLYNGPADADGVVEVSFDA